MLAASNKRSETPAAYVIGSGPNGLAAAILLVRAGLKTTILEAQPTIGGGTRSAELTLPGFTHDVCSAVHPLALSSPVFATFPLAEHGLKWIHSPIALAHPFDDGSAAVLLQSADDTARALGPDGSSYHRAIGSLGQHWKNLAPDILGPLKWPAHPWLLARFGALAPWPATVFARAIFRTPPAQALFAGMAAHSFLPLESPFSAAFGVVLALAGHGVGWPIARGGSQRIGDALASYFQSLGGSIVTNTQVTSLDAFEPGSLILCDVTPRQLLAIAGNRLPATYRRKLANYRYGPGVFKVDWALNGPIPWTAANCKKAVTIHLGGTLGEIAAAERAPWRNMESARPFVLLSQPSLFDPTRAPQGKYTAWAYCHVPNGSVFDMTARIEAQVERFAPGFTSRIIGRSTMNSDTMRQRNANLIGGDINGGAQDFRQLFTRPNRSLYRTPVPGLYICSSSTPPGGGVHGMCGFHAAAMALSDAGID